MKYPRKFYHEKTIETAFFDTSASDTLDAERYIQGQPCFLHEKEIKRLVKKKIILYNWDSVVNLNLTTREQRNLVHRLLDDGFEIYATLSPSHMFVKLDKDLYDSFFQWAPFSNAYLGNALHKSFSYDNTNSFYPLRITANTLLSSAERELHLPATEIMLLDELTAYLLSENIEETESIEFSFAITAEGSGIWRDIENLVSLRDINPDDFSRIRHFTINASKYAIQKLGDKIQRIKEYLTAQNSSVSIVPILDSNTIRACWEKLLANTSHQLDEQDKAIELASRIKSSKTINLMYPREAVTEFDIVKLIESLPNTKSLSIDVTYFLDTSFTNIEKTPCNTHNTNITDLKLHFSVSATLSGQLHVGAILRTLPNLESFYLKLPEGMSNVALPVIPSLKILEISMSSQAIDLVSLLNNFENLEFLKIRIENNTIYYNTRDILMENKRGKKLSPKLSKLKRLECQGLLFESKSDLESFLELTPNLTTLIMEPAYSHKELSRRRRPPKKALFRKSDEVNLTQKGELIPKLKLLSLINFKLSLESDFSGILNTPKLEQLNFKNCRFLTNTGKIKPQTLIRSKALALMSCDFDNITLTYLIRLLGQSLSSLSISNAKLTHRNSDQPCHLKAPKTLKEISLLNSNAPHGLAKLIATSSLTHLMIDELIPVKKISFRESSNSCLVSSSEVLEQRPSLASTASTLILNVNHDDVTYNFNRLNLVDSLQVKTLILNFNTLLKSGVYSKYLNLVSLIHFLNHLPQMETLVIKFEIDGAELSETLIKSFDDPIITPLTMLKHIHFNTPRHLSPSPSRLLQIAPNLELIEYKGLTVSKSDKKYALDLRDKNNLDTLPPSLPNSWELIQQIYVSETFPSTFTKHDSSQYNQDSNRDLKNKDDLQSPSRSQKCIIVKLAKYLELTDRLSEATEQMLSQGIYLSLSRLYQSMTDEQWSQLIKRISRFTGKIEQLDSETSRDLELCYQSFKEHNDREVGEATDRAYFIGGELKNLLSELEVGASVILSNLNHSICLRKRETNVFYVYNPNTLTGLAERLTLDKSVESILTYTLGKLVFCEREVNLTSKALSLWKTSSQFIVDGGLIAICRSPELNDYYKRHHYNDTYDVKSCINSLTIGRNRNVRPALVTMLQSKEVSWLLEQLINTLFENKPTSICKVLIDRLFAGFYYYEMREKEAAIKAFTEADGIFRRHLNDEVVEYFLNSYRAPLVELMQTPSTRDKKPKHKHRIKIPSSDNRSQAISFLETNTLNAYTLALQAHQISKKFPVFVIQEDIDLDFHAMQLTRDEDNHALISENSHPLFIFINQNKNNKNALIIVDCEDLSLTMINKYEDLFTGKTYNGIRIIALITSGNEKLRSLQDQSPLFEEMTPCTVELSSLLDSFKPPIITPCDAIMEDDYVIDLFNSKQWKNTLLGQWQIVSDTLVYQEGSLATAIESGKPIVLANAPWDDRRFMTFIQQLHLTHQINIAGRLITIPDNTTWKTASGYAHLHIPELVSAKQGFAASAPILNPYTLHSFYLKYSVDTETKALKSMPGIIEQCATDGKKTLKATLSHPLSDDDLACLAASCAKHGLKLNLYTLESSSVSSLIDVKMASHTSQKHNDVKLYVTDDYDAVTLKLCAQHPRRKKYTVFTVTGRSSGDLFDHIFAEPIIDKHNQTTFQFKLIKGAVIQALEAGQHVILKGEFSSQLAQALAPWLLDPQFRYAKQLILVTDSATHFNYMMPRHLDVEPAEKIKLICNQLKLSAPKKASADWKTDDLSTMRAKLIYAASQDGRDPWQGLNQLDISIDKTPLDIQTYEAEAKRLDKLRYNAILSVLKYSPFVFISGITGVGKTMFVNRVLSKKHKVQVFNELDNLAAWAKSSQRGLKVLFLDEFNVGTNEGYEFEDMFSGTPSVLDPKTHERLTLTKDHKVIFAGNPISYSVNRHMPRLIERHGCSVIFDPITPAYLFKTILKLLFKKHPALAERSFEICEHILNVYRYACSISSDEVLITPRELRMMAMLTITAYEFDNSLDPIQVAMHYAHTIARPFIPTDYQPFFDATFKPVTQQHTDDQAYSIIENMINLRDLRQTHASVWSKKMKESELGGLILNCQKGNPGIDYLKNALSALNVTDPVIIAKYTNTHVASKLLIDAFNEGKVVIFEEIGRSIMLEPLLNSLLMGINPNDSNTPAETPGFMVLGTHTQTDGLYQSRLSSSLIHRMVNVDFPSTTAIPEPSAYIRKFHIPLEPLASDASETEPQSEITLEAFRNAYKKARDSERFNKSWAGMFSLPDDEIKMHSMEDVKKYVERKPHSRAAKILHTLEQENANQQTRRPRK